MLNVNQKNISVNIMINNANEDPIKKSFIIVIDEYLIAKDLIKISIEKFNQILHEEQQNIFLDSDLRHYSLRQSKKNGQPKMDFPGKINNFHKKFYYYFIGFLISY